MEKENPSKLLIVTGPQGSGNHLWAKVFSMHPSVNGWSMLKDEWQGHHDEPMNEYWQEPSKLSELELDDRNKYVTSISCPYFIIVSPSLRSCNAILWPNGISASDFTLDEESSSIIQHPQSWPFNTFSITITPTLSFLS